MIVDAEDKPLFWIGLSLNDLREFPDDVKRIMGFALRQAQGEQEAPTGH